MWRKKFRSPSLFYLFRQHFERKKFSAYIKENARCTKFFSLRVSRAYTVDSQLQLRIKPFKINKLVRREYTHQILQCRLPEECELNKID